jgi:hypothetical protein
MMDFIWYFIWAFIITVVFLVPFGACLLYCFLAIRQLSIANEENNPDKRRGAAKVIVGTVLGLVATVSLWYLVISNL